MKKSVIKRRKRVIPAACDGTPEGGAPTESVASSSPPPDMGSERGSMNADGSVNLGLRRRLDQGHQQQQPQPQQPLPQPQPLTEQSQSQAQPQSQSQSFQLVPESVLRQSHRPSPPPASGDLTQYASNLVRLHRDVPESLNDDNRLAPITSFSTPTGQRQTSLSPASFLSPSRKRSFGETEHAGPENNKRLSSIKSILYPSSVTSGPSEHLPHEARYPSPGTYPIASVSPGPAAAGPASYHDARRLSDESDSTKADRRAALQREAERMREMLAAKERELAELGN